MRSAFSLALLLSWTAWGNEAFLAAEVVDAAPVKVAPSSPADAAWKNASPKRFTVSAQRTVHLNDHKANQAVETPGAGTLVVRAVASESELAVLLEWSDATKDLVRADEVNGFADTAAFEVPVVFGAGKRLPYIGMGDAQNPVVVSMQRATAEGSTVNAYVAAGFGSLTRAKGVPPVKASMAYDEAGHVWRAVFVRPLEELGALTPMAFAVWDGARSERGGYKQLSAWHFVRLPGKAIDAAWLKDLSFGYNPGDLGDAAKGRATAETVCIACHQLPGKRFAPAGFAPDLSDIGAIATASYLRDSILQPSLVLVPSLQPNNHYAKNSNPDQFRAYAKADIYEWATKDENGAVVSKMPQFTNLTGEQVSDLIAFLKTLDGHVKE